MLGLMTRARLYLAEYLLSFRQTVQAAYSCHVAAATQDSGSSVTHPDSFSAISGSFGYSYPDSLIYSSTLIITQYYRVLVTLPQYQYIYQVQLR